MTAKEYLKQVKYIERNVRKKEIWLRNSENRFMEKA